VVVCDACGHTITGQGNVVWNPSDDRDLFHVHKGGCDRTLDPLHTLFSEELDVWLRQLATNFAKPLTGRPLPIGMNGDLYTVNETRTAADTYAGRTEFHYPQLIEAAAYARLVRDVAATPVRVSEETP
jgi:hypothetical protein